MLAIDFPRIGASSRAVRVLNVAPEGAAVASVDGVDMNLEVGICAGRTKPRANARQKVLLHIPFLARDGSPARLGRSRKEGEAYLPGYGLPTAVGAAKKSLPKWDAAMEG